MLRRLRITASRESGVNAAESLCTLRLTRGIQELPVSRQKKDTQKTCEPFLLAHHEEFESPTFGSVDRRSIQLS